MRLTNTNTYMKKTSFAFMILFFITSYARVSAQAFEDWSWNTYGLNFSVPSNMKVTVNSADEFGAKLDNDLLHLAIFPWEDDQLTKETLNAEVKKLVKSLGYRGAALVELELNGFEGGYIIAEKDGVTTIVVGLLDPESATNFYALIIYGPGYEDAALTIANSFEK